MPVTPPSRSSATPWARRAPSRPSSACCRWTTGWSPRPPTTNAVPRVRSRLRPQRRPGPADRRRRVQRQRVLRHPLLAGPRPHQAARVNVPSQRSPLHHGNGDERSPERRVVVTGLGVVAPNGLGRDAFWDSTLRGELVRVPSAIDRFDTGDYSCRVGGAVAEFRASDFLPHLTVKQTDRATHMALAACRMATEDAGLDLGAEDPRQVGMYFANVFGGMEFAEREDLYTQSFIGPDRVSAYQSIAWFFAATQGQSSISQGIKGFGKSIVADRAGGHQALLLGALAIRQGHASPWSTPEGSRRRWCPTSSASTRGCAAAEQGDGRARPRLPPLRRGEDRPGARRGQRDPDPGGGGARPCARRADLRGVRRRSPQLRRPSGPGAEQRDPRLLPASRGRRRGARAGERRLRAP